MEYLFVYGTLRRDIIEYKGLTVQKKWMSTADWIGAGYMEGHLYEVTGYPGAVLLNNHEDGREGGIEKGNRKVYGELYHIDANRRHNLFAQLDEYEECSERFPQPHEYAKQEVEIVLCSSRESENRYCAWVYLYQWDVSNLIEIPSGDYLDKVMSM